MDRPHSPPLNPHLLTKSLKYTHPDPALCSAGQTTQSPPSYREFEKSPSHSVPLVSLVSTKMNRNSVSLAHGTLTEAKNEDPELQSCAESRLRVTIENAAPAASCLSASPGFPPAHSRDKCHLDAGVPRCNCCLLNPQKARAEIVFKNLATPILTVTWAQWKMLPPTAKLQRCLLSFQKYLHAEKFSTSEEKGDGSQQPLSSRQQALVTLEEVADKF